MQPANFFNINLSRVWEETIGHGGIIVRALGGAAINFGDAVYWSASGGTANKSTTANDYLLFAGIAVGGDVTKNKIYRHSSAPTQYSVCSGSGKSLLIQITGITWVYCSAAVTAPVRLGPPTTTAGQPVTYTAGQILGVALVTTTGAAYTKMQLA